MAPKLRALYQSRDSRGNPCDVLYYFWVKVLACPECDAGVDLFPPVFTRHADKTKDGPIYVVCPGCGDVFRRCQDNASTSCSALASIRRKVPSTALAICPACRQQFPMADCRATVGPGHRLYAKLVLRENGTKEYLPATPRTSHCTKTPRSSSPALRPAASCASLTAGTRGRF